MLSTLRLKNFVVIEDQTVEFDLGFTALSGESGAGKSVLVRALDFVCGGKLSLSPIRDEKRGESEVEAHFTDVSPVKLSWMGAEDTEATEFVLRRTYSTSGRTRSWINGQLATQAQLEELSEHLVSITSQSQSVRLRHPAAQRELFDQFAGATEAARFVTATYARWKELSDDLAQRRTNAEQNALKRASLEFIVEELSAAHIAAGRREELETLVRQGSQRSKLLHQLGEVLDTAPSTAMARALGLAREFSDAELVGRIESVRAEWEAITDTFSAHGKRIRNSEGNQDKLSEELAELARLERKYRTNDAGLVSMLERARAELVEIGGEDTLSVLEKQVAEVRQQLLVQCAALSKLRHAAVKKLQEAIIKELKDLGLDGLSLGVTLTELSEPQAYGLEKVEFLMGARAGKPGVSIGAAASGGELSRIFLALLVACSSSESSAPSTRAGSAKRRSGGSASAIEKDVQHRETLVFDEIDSGVSGLAARVVGDKLRELGGNRQVLCVTHLAQVASLATANLRVTKTPGVPPGSNVERLSEKEKVEEIARMLAGYKVTEQARKTASELISSK